MYNNKSHFYGEDRANEKTALTLGIEKGYPIKAAFFYSQTSFSQHLEDKIMWENAGTQSRKLKLFIGLTLLVGGEYNKNIIKKANLSGKEKYT